VSDGFDFFHSIAPHQMNSAGMTKAPTTAAIGIVDGFDACPKANGNAPKPMM